MFDFKDSKHAQFDDVVLGIMFLGKTAFRLIFIIILCKYAVNKKGGSVSELLMESLALQRIDLIARMVTANQMTKNWRAEMTTQLIVKLDDTTNKNTEEC